MRLGMGGAPQPALSIDPMHKWRQFKYSFDYIQISPTSLVLVTYSFESLTQERGLLR